MTDWIWVASSRVGERTRAGCVSACCAPAFALRTLRLADSRVDNLEDGDGEGGRLARAGLCLRDGVAALADLDNGARLHG